MVQTDKKNHQTIIVIMKNHRRALGLTLIIHRRLSRNVLYVSKIMKNISIHNKRLMPHLFPLRLKNSNMTIMTANMTMSMIHIMHK